jgi:hypothetical protein
MDDYCFRRIKSVALVMIAIAAVHIALSQPIGYYWNALQARLSGVELTASGVPEAGDSMQGVTIYMLLFGSVALFAFITSPQRASLWRRLVLIAPLSVYSFSAYVEYKKLSPIEEKFDDIYESLNAAIFIPYAAIAAITALYLVFVIVLPALRVTQVVGWATSVVAILSYLGSALFIIYNHAMSIFGGQFGESEFYTYLVAFSLDVVSYFFMLSVLMTYCTIKREERWDRLESLVMAELDEEFDEKSDEELDASGALRTSRALRSGKARRRKRAFGKEPENASAEAVYSEEGDPLAEETTAGEGSFGEEDASNAPEESAGARPDPFAGKI